VVGNPCNIVSQSAYLGCAWHVEQMTVENTSSWILSYCHSQGWDEAAHYAAKFKAQEITGRVLKDLSDRHLKMSLKIINPSHREELLSAIRNLFTIGAKINSGVQTPVSTVAPQIIYQNPVHFVPYTGSSFYNHNFFNTGVVVDQSFSSAVPAGTWSSFGGQFGCENSILQCNWVPNTIGVPSVSDNATMPSLGESFGTDFAKYVQDDFSDMVSDSTQSRSCRAEGTDVNGHSFSSGDKFNSTIQKHGRKTNDIEKTIKHVLQGPQMRSVSTQRSRSGNLKKLLLTLEPDQIPINGDTEVIRSYFVKLDSDVIVKPMKDVPNTYTMNFQSADAGFKALKLRKEGFVIRMKYPPRASPDNHVEYKALRDLQVREGKSMNGNHLKGIIKGGETVKVNQIKGRRARVVDRGWVSLKTEDGEQLLKRLSDS